MSQHIRGELVTLRLITTSLLPRWMAGGQRSTSSVLFVLCLHVPLIWMLIVSLITHKEPLQYRDSCWVSVAYSDWEPSELFAQKFQCARTAGLPTSSLPQLIRPSYHKRPCHFTVSSITDYIWIGLIYINVQVWTQPRRPHLNSITQTTHGGLKSIHVTFDTFNTQPPSQSCRSAPLLFCLWKRLSVACWAYTRRPGSRSGTKIRFSQKSFSP